MTPADGAADALFRSPLPDRFWRGALRLAPGVELPLEPGRLPDDAMILVEQGELELECRAGASRRFGRGAMIPLARLPVARIRSVGPAHLVLVAVSRGRGAGR